jgi:four helix bundle protein
VFSKVERPFVLGKDNHQDMADFGHGEKSPDRKGKQAMRQGISSCQELQENVLSPIKMSQSYKDLAIYTEAMDLYYKAHSMSVQLPRHELYELGSQTRRAADSVTSNIVEGWGRRRYKAEYIRFLIFSHASTMEVQCHLEKISRIYSGLSIEAENLRLKYDLLGKRIHRYLLYVESNWITPKG